MHFKFFSIITDKFSGPSSAIGPSCACVCVCSYAKISNEMTFHLDIQYGNSPRPILGPLQSSRNDRKNVAKVVGATSSERFSSCLSELACFQQFVVAA